MNSAISPQTLQDMRTAEISPSSAVLSVPFISALAKEHTNTAKDTHNIPCSHQQHQASQNPDSVQPDLSELK